MKAALRLEAIGDAENSIAKVFELQIAAITDPRFAREYFGAKPRRPWVAAIVGTHPQFGFEREFLRANKDYMDGNSVGSRGVFLWFILEPDTLYEVHELVSWKRHRRYFCIVVDGEIKEVGEQDARQWLIENGLSEPTC